LTGSDDATGHGFVLENFADEIALFSQMKNGYETRNRLVAIAPMTAEFLGILPPAAQAALVKFDPYVLPLEASIISPVVT
jgi:hypothetical protein